MSSKPSVGNQKSLKLDEKVICACNGLECEGICRDEHLLKDPASGIVRICGITSCTAAYNKTSNRDKRIRRKEDSAEIREEDFRNIRTSFNQHD